jgi:SAM-dependent methyltransferase
MTMEVFDRRVLRIRRDRAAPRFGAHDFLARETARRLAGRLTDLTRRFPLALELGAQGMSGADALAATGRVDRIVHAAVSPGLARIAPAPRLAADEEALPFAEGAFDLVFANLTLHWTNDLPGALIQMRRVLRPDGLLLSALLGGETLHELRAALLDAELAEEGGVSPRVSPMAQAADMGGLLQRAGFALPVVDVDRIEASYADAFALMRDLRGMGETNAIVKRRRAFTRRATLARAAALYAERHAGPDGRIPATFRIITLTAWAPGSSQQKPLKPGSAKARLADALGETEISTGIGTGPAKD